MYNIEDLTEQAKRNGASDIHLVCGLPPKYRLDGQLENMADQRLTEEDCEALCQELAKDAMYEKLEYTGELDFSRELHGIRCRCHVFKQQGKVSAAIRLLSEFIPRLDSLGLPPSALEFESMVERLRISEKTLGRVSYTLSEKNESSRRFMRSLYVGCDMKQGDIITADNVVSVRPGFGLHPKYLKQIVGKKVNADLKKGTRFSLSFIAE